MEQNLWGGINFSKQYFSGVRLNTSLSDSLKFQGDYIVANFQNEFDTWIDLSDFEKQLIIAKPTFSNENEFRKDLQITFDENLINNHLVALFNSKKVYSLMETIMEITPDNMKNLVKMASNFFTTTIFAPIFPGLKEEMGPMKKIDIRCGFSKQFLNGKIDEINISQIWFKDKNKIEFNFNVGCAVFVNPKSSSANPLELLKAFDDNSKEYQIWRSIFVKVKGHTEFDFLNDKKFKGMLYGSVKDFDFTVEELNILKGNGEKASQHEKDLYNEQF